MDEGRLRFQPHPLAQVTGEIQGRVAQIGAGVIRNLRRNARLAQLGRPTGQWQPAAIGGRAAVDQRPELIGRLAARSADVDGKRFELNPRRAGRLPQVQGEIEIGPQVAGQFFLHGREIDRVQPRGDRDRAGQVLRQLDHREPTGIGIPAIVRLEGCDQNRGHSSMRRPLRAAPSSRVVTRTPGNRSRFLLRCTIGGAIGRSNRIAAHARTGRSRFKGA